MSMLGRIATDHSETLRKAYEHMNKRQIRTPIIKAKPIEKTHPVYPYYADLTKDASEGAKELVLIWWNGGSMWNNRLNDEPISNYAENYSLEDRESASNIIMGLVSIGWG